jgi:pimeloyl-ACP methyl ester carboxylesterase
MENSPSRVRGAAIAAAVIVSAAALASAAYQEAAAARDRRRFTPLGRVVSVGGRRLHVLEEGHGPPTIVVVPALGEGVFSWVRVQRELAAEMRVVLYDRAGIGWSDPPRRGRRTSDDAAEELRSLLHVAGIEPPYVLVAHSLGGIIARRFAARYPAAVAGMVLIDSSHEQQASRRGVHGWPYGRSSYVKNAWQWQRRVLGARRLAAVLGLLHELDADTAEEALPEHAGAYRASMLSTRERRTVVREILMMARLSEPPRPLTSIPLTVITAGRQQIPGWQEMQDELAALSADSTHVVAGDAGHYVHLDAPEVVIQAIRDMARKIGPD